MKLTEARIHQFLVERFGEPISKEIATVGMKDERGSSDDKDYAKGSRDEQWAEHKPQG